MLPLPLAVVAEWVPNRLPLLGVAGIAGAASILPMFAPVPAPAPAPAADLDALAKVGAVRREEGVEGGCALGVCIPCCLLGVALPLAAMVGVGMVVDDVCSPSVGG